MFDEGKTFASQSRMPPAMSVSCVLQTAYSRRRFLGFSRALITTASKFHKSFHISALGRLKFVLWRPVICRLVGLNLCSFFRLRLGHNVETKLPPFSSYTRGFALKSSL